MNFLHTSAPEILVLDSRLNKARFQDSDLRESQISGCDLRDVRIENCRIEGATLDGIGLEQLLAFWRAHGSRPDAPSTEPANRKRGGSRGASSGTLFDPDGTDV